MFKRGYISSRFASVLRGAVFSLSEKRKVKSSAHHPHFSLFVFHFSLKTASLFLYKIIAYYV